MPLDKKIQKVLDTDIHEAVHKVNEKLNKPLKVIYPPEKKVEPDK
jgi:hypothetical protein